MSARSVVALAVAALALACKGGDQAHGANGAGVNARGLRAPYRGTVVQNGGRVTGTIALAPPRSSGSGAGGADTCALPPRRARAPATPETRAVVWLADVRAGKAIPVEKRFTITTERCDLAPRVQAAVMGGTLNVLNTDAIEHATRFTDASGSVLAVIEQFEAGQVVPRRDLLGVPGLIEARCDAHPWTRAWIHVFDHPYYAEVRADGAFTFDSVPPGEYRLMVWEESSGTRERGVAVRSGEEARVALGPAR